jgi:hypothetical protein
MPRNQDGTICTTLGVNKDAASFISQAKWSADRAGVKK